MTADRRVATDLDAVDPIGSTAFPFPGVLVATPLLLLSGLVALRGDSGYPGAATASSVLLVGVAAALVVGELLGRRSRGSAAALVLCAVLATLVAAGAEITGSLRGPLGYANASAALDVVGLGAALVLAAQLRHVGVRVLVLAAGAVCAVLPFVTGARAGAGAVIALVVVAGVALVRPGAARPAAILLAWAVPATTGGTLLLASGVGTGAPGVEPWLTVRRLALWEEAVALVADAPLLGHGPGGFAVLAPTAVADRDAVRAHHELLELAVEVGLVGAVLAVVAVVAALVLLVRRRTPTAAVTATTLALVLVHAQIDWVLHNWQVPVLLALLVGAGVAPGTSGTRATAAADAASG